MQGKKKTLEDALQNEATFPKDTSTRLLTPTKGRGINAETYRMRRTCLGQAEIRTVYETMLDGFYTTMHTSVRQKVIETFREMMEEREQIGFSRFDEVAKRGFWKMFTSYVAQNGIRLFSGERLLCAYAMYEKEIDDYVRAFYGMDNLNNVLVPMFPADSSVFFGDTNGKIKKLGEVLEFMTKGDKDALQSYQDEEEERNIAFTHFNCYFFEALCVEWGIFKELFGYDLPYQAPYGTKKIGFGTK